MKTLSFFLVSLALISCKPKAPQDVISVEENPTLATPVLLLQHNEDLSSAVFSPDGSTIVTTSDDHNVSIWDAKTGKQLLSLPQSKEGSPNYAEYSPDGKYLVIADMEPSFDIRSVADGKVQSTIKEHPARVYFASYSPNGTQLATTSFPEYERFPEKNNKGQSTDGTLNPNSPDNPFKNEGTKVPPKDPNTKDPDNTLNPNSSDNPFKKGLKTPPKDQEQPKAEGPKYDHVVNIWSAETGKKLFTLQGHTAEIRTVKYSRDGKLIVTASDDSTVKIWSAETGKLVTSIELFNSASSAEFSPDGKLVIAASPQGGQVFSLETSKEVMQLKHSWDVNWATFRPDGKQIATACQDRTLTFWDANGTKQFSFLAHEGGVMTVAYSPDGNYVVTTSSDKTAKVWRTNTPP